MALAIPMTRDEQIRKVEELGADSFPNLLRQAAEIGLELERDYLRAGQFIVREIGTYGYCELVSTDRCTCQRFRMWGRCPHHALVLEHVGKVVAL